MISRRTIGLLIVLILLFCSGRRPAAAQADVAGQLLALVNQVREQHGLTPFQYDPALAIAAQSQADYNAANGLYGHSGTGGSRPQDRANAAGFGGYVVENVVGGTDLTPQQGVTWWINSPVHYNTLITTRYAYAGTGYAVSGRQRHYTLVVGRPADGVPERPAPVANAPALVAPIVLSEPAEDGSITHVVKVGQTLWAIAARYEVTLEDLRLYNNLGEEALLRPGDKLIIRLAEGQEPPPTPTPPFTHMVREGETLWTIAARYRLELAHLLWFNGLDENAVIQPGDELTIRLAPGQAPPPTPTPQVSHIVQSGQSLWSIAAIYGLSVEALLDMNGLNATYVLQPGDELRIRPEATPTVTPSNPAETAAVEPGTAAATPLAEATLVSTAVTTRPAPSAVTMATAETASSPAAPVQQPDPKPAGSNPIAGGALILAVLLTAAAGGVFFYARRDT